MNQMNQQYNSQDEMPVTPVYRSKAEQAVTRALAVVGVVAVVIFAVWAGFTVIRVLPTLGGSLQSAMVSISQVFAPAQTKTIELSVDTLVTRSDSPYTISWKADADEKGTYTLTFSCRDNLSIDSPNADGTYQRAFCDTPFNFAGSNKEIRIVPVSTGNRYLDVPMTLSYFPEGESTPLTQKTFTLTIENPSLSVSPDTTGRVDTVATTSPSTGTTGGVATNTGSTGTTSTRPTTTTGGGSTGVTAGERTDNQYQIPGTGGTTPGTSGGRPINPNGKPDLAVKVLATGYIDSATNAFVAASPVRRDQRVAVKFEIENIGDNASDSWTFSAILPTYPPFVFQSSTQQKLNPGEKIEYTLGFDKVLSANSVDIKIFADQSLKINEPNEDNNIKIVTVQIAG